MQRSGQCFDLLYDRIKRTDLAAVSNKSRRLGQNCICFYKLTGKDTLVESPETWTRGSGKAYHLTRVSRNLKNKKKKIEGAGWWH